MRVNLRLKQAKKSLVEYFEGWKTHNPRTSENRSIREVIDFALVILYLKEFKYYQELKQLILAKEGNDCVLNDILPLLEKQYPIFLVYLYWSKKQFEKALDILKEYVHNMCKIFTGATGSVMHRGETMHSPKVLVLQKLLNC